MEATIAAPPAPALALLDAPSARRAAAPAVFVPVWAAGPAIGFGDAQRDPPRSNAADRAGGLAEPGRELFWGRFMGIGIPVRVSDER